MKKLLLAAIPLLAVLACGGDDDDDDAAPVGDPGVVAVEDNVFEPKTITVGVGDTVTWEFVGSSAHNVTGDDFASELMKDGEFEHTFDEAGEFDYVCTVHPGMKGTVEVADSAAP